MLFLSSLLGVSVVFGCVFCLLRLRARMRGRGFYPGTTELGNALHQLQRIAQPQVRYVLEEKLDEREDEDDEGGPDDPAAHLERQLRKIRNGEEVDRLRVFSAYGRRF